MKIACQFSDGLRFLAAHWRALIIIVVPIAFLPLAFSAEKESKCGFVICVMAFYWMTEALPLAITSLLPIVLFPAFGILSTDEVCIVYFKETNMMFLGTVIMATAIEHCNLHKRLALKVLLMIGTSSQRLMLGFMATTMFLSMWICNAAAAAIVSPIVIAVLKELKAHKKNKVDEDKGVSTLTKPAETNVPLPDGGTSEAETRRQSETNKPGKRGLSNEEMCYFLGVMYAANIGGTGTMTGTPTNLTFKGIFESMFPLADGINFATWMQFNVPLMIFNTFLAWLWLQIFYMGLFRRNKKGANTPDDSHSQQIRDIIVQRYAELGPVTCHEISVLCLFLLDVLLWFFRKPEFISGWASWFPDKVIKDATPAIAVVVLLFILPENLDFLKFGQTEQKESPGLLTWKVLQEKLQFGIILLLGGGFAISKASETSGLSNYIAQQLEVVVKDLSPTFILSFIVLSATFATEVSSNTAIANILLPVLGKMCRVIKLHPLFLMLPTTLSCSYAFMLPVATPPNAIVMAASNMKTSDMMKAGVGMNLICAISLIICFLFIGVPMYGFNSFPEWAEMKNVSLTRF